MNKSIRHSTCLFRDISLDEIGGVFIGNILQCIINWMFSPVTCLGNFVILHAIRKTQDLHSPSFLLLCCLAFSDFLVGAICQPSLAALKLVELQANLSSYCTVWTFYLFSSYTTAGMSCLCLAAVSVDRLLRLSLHLRYDAIVTVPRVFQTTVVLWIFSITVVILLLWISYTVWSSLILSIFVVVLSVITFCTSKIFQIVRRHQRQINDQNMAALSLQTNTVNVLKCKKSAVTILHVCGLFLIFYFPYIVIMIVDAFIGKTRTVMVAYGFAETALYINSFLNPLVYCLRMREVRRAVKNSLPARCWAT